jgi:hypothetical protein
MPRSAPPPRAYTHDALDSYLPADVLAALGDKPHIRQGRLLVFARTGRAARDLLVDLGLQSSFERRVPRLATGNDLDALRESGLGTEGSVYAVSHQTDRVVHIYFDNSHCGARTTAPIGELVGPFTSRSLKRY